jgi:diketogulonate reductase-like aldo/keto reductase
MRVVTLPGGTAVPAIGQGTWHMGERGGDHDAEADALRLGLDLGLRLIDTAEMYADGGSELVVGRAIAGRRDSVFLVSKLYPQNASHAGTRAACERSLRRLGTDRLDLYLLHWRGSVPLAETVAAFEALRAEGKILRWGVSNLDTDDMEELLAVPGGDGCVTNQVLYNPEYRGIEFDLLPWCAAHEIQVMAYSPVGQGGRLLKHAALRNVADAHGVTPAQVALAWAVRHPHVMAIPKATKPEHVRANAASAGIALTPADLAALDAAFPPPRTRRPLDML